MFLRYLNSNLAFDRSKDATTLFEMFEALQNLDNAISTVFGRIKDRVIQEKDRIKSVDSRIVFAQNKIHQISSVTSGLLFSKMIKI